jgi:hypothetical protein
VIWNEKLVDAGASGCRCVCDIRVRAPTRFTVRVITQTSVPLEHGMAWWLGAVLLFGYGHSVSPNSGDTTCLSEAPIWATVQAAIALAGIALGASCFIPFRTRGDRYGRFALVGAVALALVWITVAFPGDPREPVGGYAGCGLA